LTDPNGEKYIYIPEKETVDTMPPPIIYGDREVLLAEALSQGVVKTVVIDDLRELFPMLNTVPGWYTLEAIQPFIRFAGVIKIENFGVLGLADDENIWQGAVNSNKIQFYLYPTAGGQVNVQVLDGSVDPSAPLFQVPVKLFKSEDVTASNSLEDAWSKAKLVLEGTTDNSGQTKWNSETTPCVIGDNYTVIARYSTEYKDSLIAVDDSGWQDGCSGLIEQTIAFGEVPPPDIAEDLDGDGDVDRDDLNSILAARNTPAEGPDDPRDLDGDGMITGLDARKLVLMCTRPRCATE
jgi:hypothetical protein